jgi:hypothetical protein
MAAMRGLVGYWIATRLSPRVPGIAVKLAQTA